MLAINAQRLKSGTQISRGGLGGDLIHIEAHDILFGLLGRARGGGKRKGRKEYEAKHWRYVGTGR